MHSSSALAVLFALGAIAVPSNKHAHLHHHKREAENDVVMKTVMVQETVTVGANGNPVQTQDSNQAQAADYSPPQQPAQPQQYGQPQHQHQPQQWGAWTSYWTIPAQPQPTEQSQQPPAYTPVAPAPSSEAAPAPAPSSSEAPAPAPAPSSSQEAAPAPSSNGYDKNGKAAPKYGSDLYKQAAVESHNCHRSNHSANPLSWDQSLADAAKQWGDHCTFAHQGDDQGYHASNWPDGYGQNIAAGTNDDDVACVTSQQWYNWEVMDFPQAGYTSGSPPDVGKDVGHFSQVVWKGTTHVGCYTRYCDQMMGGAYYTVCNYGPAGNVMSRYSENLEPADGSQPYTEGT